MRVMMNTSLCQSLMHGFLIIACIVMEQLLNILVQVIPSTLFKIIYKFLRMLSMKIMAEVIYIYFTLVATMVILMDVMAIVKPDK